MRRLLMFIALLLTAGAAFAGPDPNPDPNTLPYPSQTSLSLNHSHVFFSPQVSSPPIQFQNQGTPLGVSFIFNCSTGMSCSFVNGVMTVTSTGGSGTINSCGTTNAIALYTAATTIGCDTNTTDASGAWTYTTAGALTTAPFLFTGNPVTGGTATTTVPLVYFNDGTAPTTWNTNGTYIGVNTVSGFTGNFIDFHLNGGTSLFSVSSANGNVATAGSVTASVNLLAGSSQALGMNSRSLWTSGVDGAMTATNFAKNGFSRLTLGPDTTAFPALCSNTGTVPYTAVGVGGATCTTLNFVKTAQTLQVTGSDFTCTTGCTSLATITGLSVALPTVATNWSFTCDLIIDQATAAAADQIGVQTATNASTNLAATAIAYTAAAVSTSGSLVGASSTASQSVLTFTPGATGTNLPLHLAGTVEGTSTSGTTLNIQILTGSSSDAITVKRGSSCYVY